MFKKLLNWILPPVDFTVRFTEEDVMKRLVCTCSCGSFSWSTEWEQDEPGFTLYEGIADDCPKCNCGKRFKREFKREQPVPFRKDEDTDNFDEFMARRKDQGRNQPRKKRGAR